MKKWIIALLCLCMLLVLPVQVLAEENQGGLTTQSEEDSGGQDNNQSGGDSGNQDNNQSGGGSGNQDNNQSGGGSGNQDDNQSGGDSGDQTQCQHSYGTGTVTTAATCSAAGVRTYTCSGCGDVKTESIAATGTHTYRTVTNYDSTKHILKCTGCNETITEDHVWNAGTDSPAATCLAQGKKIYTCTKCPATKEVITDKAAHTLSAWTTDDTNHSRYCTVSGCTYIENGTHSWGTATVTKAATCKEKGLKSITCTACAKTKYEEIALLTTHTYDNDCDAECNVCAAKREADHKFSKTWSKNGSNHWHECSACGEKGDLNSHVPGPVATEERSQDCLTCGYVIVAKLGHVHKPSSTRSSDHNGHWYDCTGCKMELEFEKHDFGTGCDGCKTCGYVDPRAHIYNDVWEMDKISHWAICTVCGQASDLEEHIPGPEATADKPQTCTQCGYVIAEFAEHEHTSTEVWLYNSAEHWEVCECGEKLNQEPHIWDEGKENKDDTVTYTCLLCEEVKTEAPVKEDSGFPWGVLLVILVILLLAAVGVLVWILLQPKPKGRFSR